MPGQFGTAVPITGSAIGAFAITPGASALATPIRQITIGTADGTITYTSSVDGADYTTGPLPIGSYPMFASHILGATTATGLTGWT